MAEQQTPANREAAARQLQAATQRFQPLKAQGKAVVAKAVRDAVAALLTPYPEPVTADLVEWADGAAALGEAFGVGDDHQTAMQMIADLARFIDGQGPDPRGVAYADRDRLAVWHDAQVYNLRPALQSASFPEEIEALELAAAALRDQERLYWLNTAFADERVAVMEALACGQSICEAIDTQRAKRHA